MNRIKQLRENVGWTQDELADHLNVQRATVSKYETGFTSLTEETLKKLAKIFSVSIDFILCETNDPLPVRDVDQDLHDEHNYTKELEDFLKDNVTTAMFQDYGDWSDEEKRDLLQFLKGQKALREQNKGK